MLSYLTWLAVFVWLPLAGLWAWKRRLVRAHLKTLGICVVLSLLFAVPWDSWATSIGMWSFPRSSVLGIYIINLPIEEYMFISFVTLLGSTLVLILRERFSDRRALRRSRS